jgi:hypothetical protein
MVTTMTKTKGRFTIIAIVPGIGVWSHAFHSRDTAMVCKEFLEKNSLGVGTLLWRDCFSWYPSGK